MAEYEAIEGEWKILKFKAIEISDHSKVIEHAVKYLLPSLTCLGYDPLNPTEENDWVTIIKALLNDGNKLHFMAVDKNTGTVAGIRIIGIVKRGDPESIPSFQHKKSKIIMDFLMELSDTCRIFETYPQVDQYGDFFGTSVDPKYRQMGLCSEMYRRARLLCKCRGILLAKLGFSSPYSRKAGKKAGFKELGRRLCIDCKDENGVSLNPNVDPVWYLDMGVFEIPKD